MLEAQGFSPYALRYAERPSPEGENSIAQVL